MPATYPVPIQTWQFGDQLTMIFLGGEVVSEYALRLKRELPSQATLGYRVRQRRAGLHRQRADSCRRRIRIRHVGSLLQPAGTVGGGNRGSADSPHSRAAGTQGAAATAGTRSRRSVRFLSPRDLPCSWSRRSRWLKIRSTWHSVTTGRCGSSKWATTRSAANDIRRRTNQSGSPTRTATACSITQHVFLEGLDFPTGVHPWRDGVIVIAAPEIFFARDRDGDGRADEREICTGALAAGNPQHRIQRISPTDSITRCIVRRPTILAN